MLRTRFLFVLAMSMAVSACAGGGGGGPAAPVTPVVPVPPKPPAPPAQPYVSDCATKPNALSCTTGVFGLGKVNLTGREVAYGVDRNGGTTDVQFNGLQIDKMGTMGPGQAGDDRYVFDYSVASVTYKIYQDLVSKNDGLGPVRTGSNVVLDQFSGLPRAGDGSVLTLFDIVNVLQGGLDYVQLGQISPSSTGRATTFFYAGPTSFVSMPSTGTARFDGGARGAYVSGSGATISTLSDITMTANFATGAITGSTSNFYAMDDKGAAVFTPHDLGFNFTAQIAGSTFGGAATSTTMTGTVNGAFYGAPGAVPAEAGLAYRLTETTGGGTMVGVAGLKKN